MSKPFFFFFRCASLQLSLSALLALFLDSTASSVSSTTRQRHWLVSLRLLSHRTSCLLSELSHTLSTLINTKPSAHHSSVTMRSVASRCQRPSGFRLRLPLSQTLPLVLASSNSNASTTTTTAAAAANTTTTNNSQSTFTLHSRRTLTHSRQSRSLSLSQQSSASQPEDATTAAAAADHGRAFSTPLAKHIHDAIAVCCLSIVLVCRPMDSLLTHFPSRLVQCLWRATCACV